MDLSTFTESAIKTASNAELIETLRAISSNPTGQHIPTIISEAAIRLEEFQTAANMPDVKTVLKTKPIREKRKSRADRFADAQSDVSQAKSEAEELRDELQNWLDNLPENLQSGSKADQLNEAISQLESFISSVEEAEGTDVEFPGMFG